jgi:hypothetical protein
LITQRAAIQQLLEEVSLMSNSNKKVINKVVYEGDVLIDLTEDTVTEEHMLAGAIAHAPTGQVINGTIKTYGGEYHTITSNN